ncbi:hypothetical protein [Bradyrhizobium sp. BR 1432]|uniref:hypothetical protein n=1 Tax=Bradyrhizobium sp. BR 1432 TaxID=3447966 RepID=UPI003EE72AB0
MSEVIRFVSKSERERDRLIREARAIYDSIFPAGDPAVKKQDNAQGNNHTFSSATAYGSN